ncbi:MAG: pyruvate, water dikinase [Deltaproteobacteria bacterium]|nr:pyruvate, water dikinase [Deltaproteobacteria bacterium]MBT4643983.1 pyruvate, water dikinase [Deltaproteobacteria bacterium]MBT7889871.1 pyruvate, water dikinase [Deltaproteobacteria bacterium]
MAALEKAIQGTQPFGMPFIKAKSTAACVDVFRMIRSLDQLTPGKYNGLEDRFQLIEKNISDILSPKTVLDDTRLIIPFASINQDLIGLIGSKIAKLGEAKNKIGIKVPDGFGITSTAFQKFIAHNNLQVEIDRRFQSADFNDLEMLDKISSEIRELVFEAEIPGALVMAIEEAYQQLEKKSSQAFSLALRSSALGEDLARTSFAGQYHSELNVNRKNILQAYKQVIAGKYSLPAVTYRYNCGIKDEDAHMCVGCMLMVDAVAGGVMYSQNPVDTGDDRIIINSAWGLPKSVVDGNVASDQFLVPRDGSVNGIQQKIKEKQLEYACSSEQGVSSKPLADEIKNLPSLNQEQVSTLAKMAVRLEAYFESPQDIEWAIARDQTTYCLQCRPLRLIVKQKKDPVPIELPKEISIVLNGDIAGSPGAASGPVYLVTKNADVLKFPVGAVLVAKQALPKWAPLLNRASAVIAEQGSFAGHLANVAREYGIPSVFNVKGATDKLQNDDLITVDAERCQIYSGRIDTLLINKERKRDMMAGSPVYETINDVSRLIVPLNLLDPDSAKFNTFNCNTLHDITRFIHEKSVHEMFDFGSKHKFSERSSKQLIYKVPMQWWILNLDNGFKEEVPGKYVHLKNIVSIPMLALWEGIVAIPWQGPPAIDGRGLMSVMFQATTNTALNTGTRSRYSEKNYFMITKNFCSLSSRLGFHFCTIESMVSDKLEENYISFQFKGGAADYKRRIKRIMFLGDILEENDFNIKIKEDILIARLENKEPSAIVIHLMILGYLTIHTRQLDMIMSNTASVNFYRKKSRLDIEEIIKKQTDETSSLVKSL